MYVRICIDRSVLVALSAQPPGVNELCVCVYHGELMAQMMVLSWSGMRLQQVINDRNSSFFHRKREKALAVLRSRGVIHSDSEWRNMLWDDLGGRLFVIDLEDVKWLKRPRALEPASGNTRHCVGARKHKHGLRRMEIRDGTLN
jgi:hypothetical protein